MSITSAHSWVKTLFFVFLISQSSYLWAQKILPIATPEISGGAATADFKPTAISQTKPDEDLPLVTETSSSIEAINFSQDGVNNGGSLAIPPDPHATAGMSHLVNVVNKSIEWYTKTGTQQNSQSLQSFFSAATGTFDPKVIYDSYSNRFVVVTLETIGRDDMMTGNDVSKIYVAVSKTGDPNDGWWKSSINALTVISMVNSWADYPGLALDEEAIYLTANMFGFADGAYNGVRLWIVPKGVGSGGIYDGGALNESIYDPYSGGGIATTTQPAHTIGVIPANVGTYLLGYGGLSNGTNEFVQCIRINNPLGMMPTFNLSYVDLGDLEDFSIGSFPNAPQMNSDSLISTGDRRLLNAVYRDGKIALCFTYIGSGSNAGQPTAHWAILDHAGGGSPTLLGQGDVGGEDIASGTYTFYPSVAMNASGDLAIGFAASAPTIFPGAYYTGRNAADPAGATDAVKTLRAGVDYYERTFGSARNRWGDYTATVVDPQDDQSFWVYNEYAISRGTATTMPNEDGRWGTAYGKFSIDNPCNNTLDLTGTVTAGTYVANTINITGEILSPAMVSLDAMNINMTEFTVNLGATLETFTNGCP
ncbi:MAG: hypothetical protein KDC53_02815 [Saprospiraceae bacterium]|nr:hypothetical protein [Saprospiraceae bacterium]